MYLSKHATSWCYFWLVAEYIDIAPFQLPFLDVPIYLFLFKISCCGFKLSFKWSESTIHKQKYSYILLNDPNMESFLNQNMLHDQETATFEFKILTWLLKLTLVLYVEF